MTGLGREVAKAAKRALFYGVVSLVIIAIAAFVIGRCSV
jgi:hypothetical protein